MENPTYRLEKVVKAREDVLEDFVGPLDVILYLLSKNKIEIKDIQIAAILDQYLTYLDEMKRMDLDIASEFVIMASHLIYIKTKMLLSINDEEALSEMEQLIRSLEEHQRHEIYEKIKTVTVVLAERSETGGCVYVRDAEVLPSDKKYKHSHEKSDIIAAVKSVLRRAGNRLPPPIEAFDGIVGAEIYPVKRKTSEIISLLLSGVKRFKALFKGSASRSEIVATFVAVLELCKDNDIKLTEKGDDYAVTYVGRGVRAIEP